MILQKMKKTAEDYLGMKLQKLLLLFLHISMIHNVRLPKKPEKLQDLKVRSIINEPTAAALAYGLDKKGQRHENCRV